MKSTLSLLLLALLALSCQGRKAGSDLTVTFDSTLYQDSAMYSADGGNRVTYRSIIPVGAPSPLLDSLRYWICEQFGDTLHLGASNLGEMLSARGQQSLLDGYMELTEMVADMDTTSEFYFAPCYESMTEITKIYEDDEVITLHNLSYIYLAGAHGMASVEGATFSKADGHRLAWDLLAGYSPEQLNFEIIKGLKLYFDLAPEAPGTDEELFDNLLLPEDITVSDLYTRFPLPDTAPWLTADGVVLLYQQYEIAPYACGMPECILPRRD